MTEEEQALARIEQPLLSLEELVDQVQLIQRVMERVMQDGEHYGMIPGASKPSLFKAGAEKLCSTFKLRPDPHLLDDYCKQEEDFITYTIRCDLYHTPSGNKVGSGVGSCNSREKKYAGCEPWDIDNTVLKMAKKRALIDATLTATSASDIFTQDLEDLGETLLGEVRQEDESHGVEEEVEDEDTKLRRATGRMIREMSGGDVARGKELLQSYSGFRGSNGEWVEGKTKINELKGKWLKATHSRVKKAYEEDYIEED